MKNELKIYGSLANNFLCDYIKVLNLKKLISLRVQKIITFIPLVNCFMLFIWLYNYSKIPSNLKLFFKAFFVAFVYALPFIILNILLSKLFTQSEIIEVLRTIIGVYFTPLFMGVGLIKCQEKYLSEYFNR